MAMPASYAGPACELQPDAEQIAAFLSWWFEKCNRGVIELGWMDANGHGLVHFAQFERGDIQTAVATAVQENLIAGQSMYVRASTIDPWKRAGHRTTDMDAEQSPGVWGDIDTKEDLDRARTVETIVRPNAQVITGSIPHMRVQSWFKLSEPITNPELTRALNVRLHRLYGGDPAVVNPSRLMRLPGTIAWPYKEGRVPELTHFVRPAAGDSRPASYPLSLLTSQLPGGEQPAIPQPPPPAAFAAGLSSVSAYMAAIKSGRGWHDAVVRLVAHWVGRGFSTAEILGHAPDWTLSGYTVAHTRAEMTKAIEGARLKWGVPDQETVVGSEPTKPFGESIIDPWGNLEPPPFPIDALPEILRRYVEVRARIMGADPCALAWAALSACGAALDGRTRVKMKRVDNWRVPAPLWIALIGRSSSKKTPIFTDAWAPLEELQNRALSAYADQVAQHNRLSKEEKASISGPPKPIRLMTHDATVESIQDILSNQDRGLAYFRDELAGFISGFDKYANGGRGGSDRAFFLQAYNGGSHVTDRIGRGTVAVRNLLMTICGGIQPERLAQFRDLADDGLWQRFIPIIVGPGALGTDEAPGEAVDDFKNRLQGMVDASNGDIASMSEAAHEIRGTIERDIFALERSEPMGARFASFTGKLPGVFGRLCLVLSYVERHGLGYVVSGLNATRARTLVMECIIPHALRVYRTMGGSHAEVETTQAIASFVLTKKLSRVVISDLTKGVRACRNQGVEEIRKMLSPLVAGAWLLPENENPFNRAWLVNPAVHSLYEKRAAEEMDRRETLRALLNLDDDQEGC